MASEDSRLDKLINQCKSNDVDVKVDALTKLQAEFESGVEISDMDAIINVFKACLRTSNQHLTNAALSTILPLLPLLISRPASQLQSNSVLSPSTSSSSTSTSYLTAGVIDIPTLRHVLSAFLSQGGIIDRLGDKERAQLKARESLVILGGFAFRSSSASTVSSKSGKGVETPLMIFERFLKDGGLASKVWKVREQSILTLVHIRRGVFQFPMRPYLSLLVDCLEDTDAHVRDCARTSVVELFSGPGVTDAARADLKKEMSKKNVRKTIVDGVLAKLLGGGSIGSGPQSHEGSENGDATTSKPKDYVPPSLTLQSKWSRVVSQGNGLSRATSYSNLKDTSRPASRGANASPPPPSTPTTENADVHPVYVASSRDLENEFAAMAKPFEGKETEHNWAARERGVQRVRGMLKGDVHMRYSDTFMACLKDSFMQWSLKTLASLRTTVAVNTCLLYSEMATELGTALDPYCDLLLSNLLKMAGFTKKITAQQTQLSVTAMLTNTSAPSRIVLPLLWNTLQEKNVQARAFVVAHLKTVIEIHGGRSKHAIEASGGLETLEKSIKKALSDPNPAVKETARQLFWVFESTYHDSAMTIMDTLDATARKQLERACPNPEIQAIIPPSTPKTSKKSSVAAAIAASRAKAKVIATAPPTLRHQATSAAQTPALRRAGSPVTASTSPKSTTAVRPSSPLRHSTSSSPPFRPRIATNVTRSVSSTSVSLSHSRTPSGTSSQRARSPSLSDHYSTQRRSSSPLAASTSGGLTTLRRAMQTALPASPPSSVGQVSPTPRGHTSTLRNGAVPVPTRQSSLLPSLTNGEEESLLLAQTIPIPEGDTDSEEEHSSVNLMSFSAPFEMYPPTVPKPLSLSPRSNDSKPTASVSNALSSGSLSDIASGQPVVEDALRARAEQAESAAERLLELVEPDDELQHPVLPASLMNRGTTNGHTTVKTKSKPPPIPISRRAVPPVTPSNRASAVLRQAAMFKDSPVYNKRSTSLLDVLQGQRHETGWWLKRTSIFAKAPPLRSRNPQERIQELQDHIAALERGEMTKDSLQRLALICLENTVAELSSPLSSPGADPISPSPFVIPRAPSLHSDLWENNRTFVRLFNNLMQYLEPTRSEEELEYGLIIVWEMLENQAPYFEGREADLFSMLLGVRYCNKLNVLEATSTIRDALTAKIDPVYGLTTFHASLKTFHSDPFPTIADEDVKAATYAFGLIALGKFILRLPAEIAEEELPRLKGTLISALNDKTSLIVRESAAASIIAAQLVLRDETHLFALLDGLADDKKNLLTYLFDKHGARGLTTASSQSGMVKLEKEIRRLDTRTSTPLRGPAIAAQAQV